MKDKTTTLIIRMAIEDKEKVTIAAAKQGLSITEFVTSATLNKAKAVLLKQKNIMENNDIRRPTHGGIPTYFRALCYTASKGGEQGYNWVGFSFSQDTESEVPSDADSEQWREMLGQIQKYIEYRDEENIWLWYKKTYPKALALIPAKRRKSFVRGILKAYDEGKLWFM